MLQSDGLLPSSAALPLLLQHRCLLDDHQALLQLSCTSKQLRAAISQHCKGRVHLDYVTRSGQHAEQVARWLAQHAQLLGVLNLYFVTTGPSMKKLQELAECVESHLAEGLQRCAQQNGPLLLKQLQHNFGEGQAGAIVSTLSADTLVSLSLSPRLSENRLRIRNCNLSAFSKLQSLRLCSLPAEETPSVVATMPAFVSLVHLELSGFFTVEQLAEVQKQLPIRLRHLALRGYDGTAAPLDVQLQLQHLGSLESLDVIKLSADAQLPHQLVKLHCVYCNSTASLLPCSQLQQLHVRDSRTTAEDFSQLSVLTSLTGISLSFAHDAADAVKSAASVFDQPPLHTALRDLSIICSMGNPSLQVETLQQLRWLSDLTALEIYVQDVPIPASPADIGAILQHLTTLQRLEVFADPGPHLLQPVLQEPPALVEVDAVAAVQLLLSMTGHVVPQPLAALAELAILGFGGAAADQELCTVVHQAALEGAGVADIPAYLEHTNPAVAERLQQYMVNMQQVAQQQHQHQQGQQVWLPADMLPWTTAVAQLPQLVSLKLKSSGLDLRTVEPLKRMTQLTRLTISGMGFDDMPLMSLLFRLTGLKRLSVTAAQITDASVFAVGQLLKHLTELELTECLSVTNRSVAELTGLQHLAMIEAEDAPNISNDVVTRVVRTVYDRRQAAARQ